MRVESRRQRDDLAEPTAALSAVQADASSGDGCPESGGAGSAGPFLTPTLPPRDATDCAGNALRNALTRPF